MTSAFGGLYSDETAMYATWEKRRVVLRQVRACVFMCADVCAYLHFRRRHGLQTRTKNNLFVVVATDLLMRGAFAHARQVCHSAAAAGVRSTCLHSFDRHVHAGGARAQSERKLGRLQVTLSVECRRKGGVVERTWH